jgi:hypothetical protein
MILTCGFVTESERYMVVLGVDLKFMPGYRKSDTRQLGNYSWQAAEYTSITSEVYQGMSMVR